MLHPDSSCIYNKQLVSEYTQSVLFNFKDTFNSIHDIIQWFNQVGKAGLQAGNAGIPSRESRDTKQEKSGKAGLQAGKQGSMKGKQD